MHAALSFDGDLLELILLPQFFQILQEGGDAGIGGAAVQLEVFAEIQEGVEVELIALSQLAAVQVSEHQVLAGGMRAAFGFRPLAVQLMQMVSQLGKVRFLACLFALMDQVYHLFEQFRFDADVVAAQPDEPIRPIPIGDPPHKADQWLYQRVFGQLGIGLVDAGDAGFVQDALHLHQFVVGSAEDGDAFAGLLLGFEILFHPVFAHFIQGDGCVFPGLKRLGLK